MQLPNLPEFLSRFEKSGPEAREFVFKQKLWQKAVQRDFPHQYAAVFDNSLQSDSTAMKSDIRNLLDQYSLPERRYKKETYWKRLYEYMYRPWPLIPWEIPKETNDVPQNWALIPNAEGKLPEPWTDSIVSVNPNDSNIFYWYPGLYSGSFTPQQMIEINFTTETSKLVPFDNLLTTNIIPNSDKQMEVWNLNSDGLHINVLFKLTSSFWKQLRPNHFRLMSCMLCDKISKWQCENCEAKYCSQKCQAKHWPIHQLHCYFK